ARERVAKTEDTHEGIRIRYFRNRSNFFSAKVLYFNPLGFRKVLEATLSQFDVVHIHEFRTHMSFFVSQMSKRSGVPAFLQPQGALPNVIEKRWLKAGFDWFYGNRILKNIDRLLAFHENEKAVAERLGLYKVCIVPNGIDLEAFAHLPDRGQSR